jgi:hypothetical protein
MPYSGRFLPKNPKKYNGDSNNIIYRSSWEVRVMKYLDDHPNVLWWSSEELAIPYKSPIDNKVHRYFPDFIAKMKRKDGSVMTYVLEVKPEKQTKMPVKRKKTQTYINETVTYAINQEKWRAAELFCFEHGWQFKLITEKELGLV